MFEIRPFQPEYIPTILELCNTSMSFDQLADALLREKLMDDPDFDPELVGLQFDQDKLVGFMHGLVRLVHGEKIAYIKLMAVHPSYQRQGLARYMYQTLEPAFKKRGATRCRIYDVPMNYFMPGIDPRYTAAICFAERLGFRRFGDTSNMMVYLPGADFTSEAQENDLHKHGITISRAKASDKDEVLAFIDRYFDLWQREIGNTFNTHPISLHIARENGELFAFSGHNGNNIGTGWFGPMGTHPDKRGRGVGGILLKRCLADIQAAGLEKAIIPWVGPIAFYSHYAGAQVERVFWRYELTY